MADILIRGMEMPKDCGSCVFCENEMFQKYCPLSDNYYDWDESSTGNRPSDCPLLPLPEGHVDLVDVKELLNDKEGLQIFKGDFRLAFDRIIERADTIVPAEGGTNNA